MLGFIIFLAFASYHQSGSGAETEALIVAEQLETAQFLPVAVRVKLTEHRVHDGGSDGQPADQEQAEEKRSRHAATVFSPMIRNHGRRAER